MTVKNSDLFYCYSRRLSDYIYEHGGLTPLTIAKNMKSGNIFSLYAKSSDLQAVLDKYSKEEK